MSEKKKRFIARQKALGRKQFGTWISPEAISRLHHLRQTTKRSTLGDVIEEMLGVACPKG